MNQEPKETTLVSYCNFCETGSHHPELHGWIKSDIFWYCTQWCIEGYLEKRGKQICHYCYTSVEGHTRPDGWVETDDEMFCSRYCATTYWTNYRELSW